MGRAGATQNQSEYVKCKEMVLEIEAMTVYDNELFSNISNVYKSKLIHFNKQLILNTDIVHGWCMKYTLANKQKRLILYRPYRV